jgi:hypothetical protein
LATSSGRLGPARESRDPALFGERPTCRNSPLSGIFRASIYTRPNADLGEHPNSKQPERNPNAHAGAIGDSDTHPGPVGYPNADAHTICYANAHADTIGYAHTHPHTNGYANAHSHTISYANAHADTNGYAYAHADPATGRLLPRGRQPDPGSQRQKVCD